MIFEIELKNLIREQYKSVRNFSQIAEIPYSTIDNIFKRSIQGVSIQVVLKICSMLNIDVEEIQNDKLVLKDVANSSNSKDKKYILAADEERLLGNYNKLNTSGKEKAQDYTEDLTENEKYTSSETELERKLNA